MKRKPRLISKQSSQQARTLDPDGLTGIRGGVDLGVAIRIPTPLAPNMPLQHNETLVRI